MMGNTADDFSWSATYIAPSSNMTGSLKVRNSLIGTGLISECPMSLAYFLFSIHVLWKDYHSLYRVTPFKISIEKAHKVVDFHLTF